MRLFTLTTGLLCLIGCNDYGLFNTGLDLDVSECLELEIPSVERDPTCRIIATGTFTPVVEWEQNTFTEEIFSKAVVSTPMVAHVTDDNGDGTIGSGDIPDILFVTVADGQHHLGGTIRAISGDGSGTHFTAAVGQVDGFGNLAVGDIDNDGVVELVVRTDDRTGYRVYAYEHDGSFKWSTDTFGDELEGINPACAIADMDADGSAEIVCGRVIFNADGTTRGIGEHGAGLGGPFGPTAFPVDLDLDGVMEVVTGNALYTPDGETIWHVNEPDGFVAAGNFDDDPEGEIVSVSAGALRLLDTDGTRLWSVALPGPGNSGGPPTIADFDGDEKPEIGVAGQDRYTVFDTDGTQLWQQSAAIDLSGVTGSSVFDFEGDGVAEVVYADEERLFIYSGIDGAVRLETDHRANITGIEYPIVADVDADGQAEIIFGNSRAREGREKAGIVVIGDADNSWEEGEQIWNQYAFHIHNINPDGTVPVEAEVSWDLQNSFRAGPITRAPEGMLADLTIVLEEVCPLECRQGSFTVSWRVENRGALASTAEVELWLDRGEAGEEQVASQEIGEIGPGRSSGIGRFDLDDADLSDVVDVIVRVVANEDQCDDGNDEARLGRPLCFEE